MKEAQIKELETLLQNKIKTELETPPKGQLSELITENTEQKSDSVSEEIEKMKLQLEEERSHHTLAES